MRESQVRTSRVAGYKRRQLNQDGSLLPQLCQHKQHPRMMPVQPETQSYQCQSRRIPQRKQCHPGRNNLARCPSLPDLRQPVSLRAFKLHRLFLRAKLFRQRIPIGTEGHPRLSPSSNLLSRPLLSTMTVQPLRSPRSPRYQVKPPSTHLHQ